MRLIQNFLNDMVFINNSHLLLSIILIYLLYSSYMDFNYFKIPQKISLVMVILRLIIIPYYSFSVNHFLGGVIPFVFLWVIAAILYQNMGGDIKFLGAIGLWLGINIMVPAVILSCILVLSTVAIFKFIKKEDIKIAYAGYFSLGFIILSLFVR